METYILLQDRLRPVPNGSSRGIITAAVKALAAVSVTGTLMLALLPPSDVTVVQQALATAAVSPDGTARA